MALSQKNSIFPLAISTIQQLNKQFASLDILSY